MHKRLAHAFGIGEAKYKISDSKKDLSNLSEFGKKLTERRKNQSDLEITKEIFGYFDGFKAIIPQGSVMSILGSKKIASLSNCMIIPSPEDSYGGIMRTDEQLVQLMKRRCGVGMSIDSLRPANSPVSNSAGSSTGASSFMERFSNSTREVSQSGRRGALMQLMDCRHPDIFSFVKAKQDRTKVTGANISVMLTDKFMQAVKNNEDFICKFPIDIDPVLTREDIDNLAYNKLTESTFTNKDKYIMKIHARELYDLIIEMAWENAEPGIAFIDRIQSYSPDGAYKQYKPKACNPCSEIWTQFFDSCRLMATNLFTFVAEPFTKDTRIIYDKVYEGFYMQQRLADILVDLELEHIDRIINKIKSDPESEGVKSVELNLWLEIQRNCKDGRRTGCGITALADMLAALNLVYDSDESLKVIEQVFKTKMRAELDCTIDLAILRGTFKGWNPQVEFGRECKVINIKGINEFLLLDRDNHTNNFYKMVLQEFPEQSIRMCKFGRRNVSWSTCAPTGSVSILTKTSSGIEPLFAPYYMRRKKINPTEKGNRVDFVDQNGDSWTEFPVLHPKFKYWIDNTYSRKTRFIIVDLSENSQIPWIYTKENLELAFKESPWYKSTANDISWERRVKIQSVIQKYTSHSISSTLNLPNTATKEDVSTIYTKAWELGLKGCTVYKEGSRSGVLVASDSVKKGVAFSQKDAVKRPKSLDAVVKSVKVKGDPYTVIISTLENHPYEIFVLPFVDSKEFSGKVVKEKKNLYNLYENNKLIYENIGSVVTDEEAALTRIISTSLRHGTHCKFLVEQLNKTNGNLVSFSKAISRVLKGFIPEGVKSTTTCINCGSSEVVFEEGCSVCKSCGTSRCG